MKCWKGTKLFLLMIFVCGLAFILNDHPQQVVNATDIRTFYVSNTGDDHSDGLSANHPCDLLAERSNFLLCLVIAKDG